MSVLGNLVVVIPRISIACHAALSVSSFPFIFMCTDTLHSLICLP